MSYSNSQKQTICRRLTEYIQLGFYDDVCFPTAMEIAKQFDVSYCPAQQALKELEQAGIIKICRGAKTIIRKKPYENYLDSNTFRERVVALLDLSQSLQLLAPIITFQGMYDLQHDISQKEVSGEIDLVHYWKKLYWLFKHALEAMGSKTVMSLYYDMGAFIGSAYIDIFHTKYCKDDEKQFLRNLEELYVRCFHSCTSGDYNSAKQQIYDLSNRFFAVTEPYLKEAVIQYREVPQKEFVWVPHKGRTKYCDLIALDLVRKINQGLYPVGSLLPNGKVLADTYHVSTITIRRTIDMLNQLGFTKTRNGVGTHVILTEDKAVLFKLKNLKLDDSLRTFLEAMQLLAVTCVSVIQCSFPYFRESDHQAILDATAIKETSASIIAFVGACLQALVHCCPLMTIREIYRNLMLLLLSGNVLQYNDFEKASDIDWNTTSKVLADAITTRDSKRFAYVFYKFITFTFCFFKDNLSYVEINDIEQIAVPIYFE